MLRVRARELRHERFHGALLSDNLVERLRAQEFHDGLREMDLVHLFELLALLRVLRRLRRAFFLLEHLHADVFDVVLMILLELVVDLLLDGVLDVLARHHVGDAVGKLGEHLGDLLVRRRGAERRILVDDAFEREHAVAAVLRAHERERVELAGLQHELVRAHRVDEDGVERLDLAVEFLRDELFLREVIAIIAAVRAARGSAAIRRAARLDALRVFRLRGRKRRGDTLASAGRVFLVENIQNII